MSLTVTFIDVNGNEQILEDATPGQSLMEFGKANGVEGILADCGGACACATCHVYVDPAWIDRVGPADDIEAEMLDFVSDLQQPTSRLSCQIQLREELDGLKVTVAPAGF